MDCARRQTDLPHGREEDQGRLAAAAAHVVTRERWTLEDLGPLKEVTAYEAVRALNHNNMPQDAEAMLHNKLECTLVYAPSLRSPCPRSA